MISGKTTLDRLDRGRLRPWWCAFVVLASSASPLLAAETGGSYILPSTIWAIVSFLIVLFVLTKKLIPPILKAMDDRAKEIRESLDAAALAKADAEKMISQHESELEKARDEATAIIEEGRADAQRLKDSIVASAKKEAQEITDRSVREIEQAKVTAVDELQKMSARLAIDIASELIRKNLNPEEQRQLIEERIREFPAA